tara:strand:- start:31705 stop:32721 length:1017 start_codon:yes stop_codon:yes gene_type:complete
MAKQGLGTGTSPNDGTGDTLLSAALKINANFDDIYNVFGDTTNLVSFVSFASTAGYSTNCGIASTSVSAGIAASVSGEISVNTTGVITASYANIGGVVVQQSGVPAEVPFAVGFAQTMLKVRNGMVGIGTSLPTSQLSVTSYSLEEPALQVTPKSNGHAVRISDDARTDATAVVISKDGKVGIASTAPTSKLTVQGDAIITGITTISGTSHLNGSITEKVVGNWNTALTAIGGTLSVDVNQGTVVLGGLTTSVVTWDFYNVTTLNSKATTVTLINDAGTTSTYGDACKVNGAAIAGGVRWVGGSPPPATNNEDILTFSIIRDSTGSTRVYCSSSLNIF